MSHVELLNDLSRSGGFAFVSALEAEAVRDHASANPFDADFFRGDKLLLAGRTRYVKFKLSSLLL